MFMTSVPRRLSSTVWVLASIVSLGLAGCAAAYDNKAGITPAPVQILWNTDGPPQTIELSVAANPNAIPPIVGVVGDDTPSPTASNPYPVPPIPDPNNPLQTPTTYGTILTTTPLSAAELNATAVTLGTFVYTPGEGTFLTAGTQTLSVTFTPTDTTHYAVTTRTVKINVLDPTTAGQAALVPESVQIVGGGYIDGVFFHPQQQNLRYVRTDVGGAYRWVQEGTSGTAPTCPGWVKPGSITPTNPNGTATAPKGNNGEFLECGYWAPLLDFLGRANGGDMGVESLGLDPSDPMRLYLSTGLNYNNDPTQQNHFYLSDDQGKTFTLVNAPFPINGNDNGRDAGERFAVDPNLGTTIYYGSRTAGLWKSLDRGMTWNNVTTFPVTVTHKTAGAGVVFVIFVPSSGTSGTATPVIYAGVSDYNYYNANGSNNGTPFYSSIYRSVDSGATWQVVPGQPTSVPNPGGSSPANYNLTPIHAVFGSDGVSSSQGSLYITYFSDQGPGDSYPGAGAVYEYTPTVGTPGGPGTWTNITPSSVRASSDDGGYSGITLDAERPGVIMVSTMDDYNNGDAIYRSLHYGQTWTIVEQNKSGALNDDAFSPWLDFGVPALLVGTENWPSALVIDPFNSNHAVFGSGDTLWDTQNLLATDVTQQPIFSVGAYGSAPSGVKQVFGGSSIEETVVNALSSPPAGAPLLSAVGDLGTFVHISLDVSPALGADAGPLFTTGTSVDFAQNASLTIVRVGTGVNTTGGYSTTAPYYKSGVLCPATSTTGCTQVQVPLLLATSTTQGAQGGWVGHPTLFAAPNLQSVTPTTQMSAGGGTVAISADATSIVWATVDFPPACTGDGGNTWTPAVNGIIGAQVVSDRVTPGQYYTYDPTSGKLLMGVATVSPVTSSNAFQCSLTFNTMSTLPANSPGQLTASFGGSGDVWLAINGSSLASANGLYHSTNAGKTLTLTGSFTQAYAVGVGAPATSSAISAYSKPAVYTVAVGASGYGFYRSIDNGTTWVNVSNPAHLLGTVNQIVGDPRTFGRYYIGTGGRGIAYVDSQ
jgi:xyloglucan-specific exo-beta-1,4-glucanase